LNVLAAIWHCLLIIEHAEAIVRNRGGHSLRPSDGGDTAAAREPGAFVAAPFIR
jgi:hypothetical protein